MPPQTSFVSAADLPIASEDAIVTIHVNGADVGRKVFAGDRVPAELVDAWREQTGAPLTDAEQAREKEAEAAATERADLERKRLGLDGPKAQAEIEEGDPAPARKRSTRASTRDA